MVQDKKSNKLIKILIVIIVVAILAGGGYFLMHRRSANNANTQQPAPSNTVNYNPPTDEEKTAGDTQKETNIQKDEEIAKQQGQLKPATVVVTDASQYDDGIEVRAYISNAYEDGGTCTATFTKGSQTVTKNHTAFKDATTTQCGTIKFTRAEFPSAGDWNLKVVYASSTTSGTTAGQTVTIH